MQVVKDFKQYEVLYCGDGEKIEKWNDVILSRPETSAIWALPKDKFKIAATYKRSNTGGGFWDQNIAPWQIKYKNLTFNLKLMGFKHTGLFPEQSYNWDLLMDKIKNAGRKINVLNLFAYTGGATLACASMDADVVHVDASRGMVDWAKENVKSSNLMDKNIRFIVDDVKKFVKREIRRGHKYDIIIMDPPTFGRGNKKEVWNIEKDLFNLVKDCTELLSEDPLLFLINSYSNNVDKTMIENIMNLTINKKYKGNIYSDDLGFEVKNSPLIMPCGLFVRWEK